MREEIPVGDQTEALLNEEFEADDIAPVQEQQQ